jgi:hypothetical protein
MTQRPAVCAWCGAWPDGDEPPLTWTVQTTPRGVELFCDTCTREHLRAIEAKLDADWF